MNDKQLSIAYLGYLRFSRVHVQR